MTDLDRWSLPVIPDDIERILSTPHAHEHPVHNAPVWIIWKTQIARTGIPFFPQIDTVCDDVDSARYHVRMILEENRIDQSGHPTKIDVERVPANHRFGSSMQHLQMAAHMAIWKERIRRAGHAIQEQLGAGAGELRQVIDAQIATVNGVATVYELIRERHGQSSRYWMRSGDKEWPIGNDAAVFIRQQWAIGQPVDLDLT